MYSNYYCKQGDHKFEHTHSEYFKATQCEKCGFWKELSDVEKNYDN